MYRVSRKTVIAVESCDNLMMRLAFRLGYTSAFELQAKNMRGQGGVDFGAIPNFIYRWREEEFEKTIRSFDPTIDQEFLYFYDLNLPEKRLRGNSLRARVGRALASAVRFAVRLMPRQGNTFIMVAYKDRENCPAHPWLRRDAGGVVPNPEYYARLFPVSGAPVKRHREATPWRHEELPPLGVAEGLSR
jgi:hypothetical protein